jgi:SAM-dependent methyltransferase
VPRDYRTLFERSARTYDETVFREGTYDHWVWLREQAYLLELLDRRLRDRPVRYLDFACGPGRIIGFLEGRVASSTGIDVSAPALELARAKLTRSTLVCGDLTRDPTLLEGPFDLITVFRFFLGAQEELRREALAALRPLLAPGGLLVIGLHGNNLSLRGLTTLARRLAGRRVPALGYYAMARLLRQHGMRIVEFRGITPLTQKVWALAPEGARRGIERLVRRSRALQHLCVNLVVVAERSDAS